MLLTDRAMGELQPEVVELLDEYIAGNAKLAAGAREVDETLRLARDFAQSEIGAVRKSGRHFEWRTARRTARLQLFLPRTLGFAACLAAGILVGWEGSSRLRQSAEISNSLVGHSTLTVNAAQASASLSPSDRNGRLWSVSRIAMEFRSTPTPRAIRHPIIWDSKTQQPRLEKIQ